LYINYRKHNDIMEGEYRRGKTAAKKKRFYPE